MDFGTAIFICTRKAPYSKKSPEISLGAFSCEWQDSNLQPTGS